MCLEIVCETKDGLVLLLLGSPLVALGISAMIAFVWKKRKKSEAGTSDTQQDLKDSTCDTTTSSIDFQDLNESLQQDLRRSICNKIESLKSDINVRGLELKRRINLSNLERLDALKVVESKYKTEVDEVDDKYRKLSDSILIEYEADVRSMKDTLKNLKVVLVEGAGEEGLEQGRQELECPVCLEEMKPPRRIWQCADGHPVCEYCRKKPQVTCCPACRKYLVGRSTIAEKLARAVFGEEKKKITLTGYTAVKQSAEQVNKNIVHAKQSTVHG